MPPTATGAGTSPAAGLEKHTPTEWRDLRHLTIPELAKAAGLSRTTVEYVVNGRSRPSLETALAIAATLGVFVEQIDWPPITQRPPSYQDKISKITQGTKIKGKKKPATA